MKITPGRWRTREGYTFDVRVTPEGWAYCVRDLKGNTIWWHPDGRYISQFRPEMDLIEWAA